jgi:hypothetical protein
MKQKPKKITRITKTEFETEDGVIHPIPFLNVTRLQNRD